MSTDQDLQAYLDGALATFGIEADDIERAVMRGAWNVWEPGIRELLEHEPTGERDDHPDLSRGPAG